MPGGLASRLGGLLGVELKLPRLVLLDVGMIARLSSEDQHNLVGFFKVSCRLWVRRGRRVCRGEADGYRAAAWLDRRAQERPPVLTAACVLAALCLSGQQAWRVRPPTPAVLLPPPPLPLPQGLTSMDGAELADSIMTFAEERPSNPSAFR